MRNIIMTKPTDMNKTNNIDELKANATKQLKKILTQGKNIKDFQSNIDLIIKRYHTNDSFLDNLANSYGSLSWWIKLGMLASTVSIAACIGIVCNLVIVLAVVTFVLYAATVLILENHHAAVLKRDKKLSTDIIELEESLVESVQHINEIEESLTAVFTSLCEMNLQQAEDIEEFESKIVELEAHIKQLIEINGKLDITKNILVDSTQKIGEAFEKAKISLNQLTDSLSKNATELDETDQTLLVSTTELFNDHERLKQFNTVFEVNHTALSGMTEDLSELVDSLKIHAAATEAFNEEALDKLSLSINKTLSTTLHTDAVISRIESTVNDADKILENYKTEKAGLDNHRMHKNTEYQQRARNTQIALERANNLLASTRQREPGGLLSAYTPLMQ